jgi:hypothetical protein
VDGESKCEIIYETTVGRDINGIKKRKQKVRNQDVRRKGIVNL